MALLYELLLCTLLPVTALVALVLRLWVTFPEASRVALPLLWMLPRLPLDWSPLRWLADPSAFTVVVPARAPMPPFGPRRPTAAPYV